MCIYMYVYIYDKHWESIEDHWDTNRNIACEEGPQSSWTDTPHQHDIKQDDGDKYDYDDGSDNYDHEERDTGTTIWASRRPCNRNGKK